MKQSIAELQKWVKEEELKARNEMSEWSLADYPSQAARLKERFLAFCEVNEKLQSILSKSEDKENKYITQGYKDVTDKLGQFNRGVLISVPSNCPSGLMVGGKRDGETWIRRYNSPTMQHGDDTENMYYRTGEIFYKDNVYYVVYRPVISKSKSEDKEDESRVLVCGMKTYTTDEVWKLYSQRKTLRSNRGNR